MTTTPITLQDLRQRLYLKAKAETTWRFWGLYVHVCKMEALQEAYKLAKENDGAPGIDGVTFETGIFRDLDKWLRHRLRMVQLKQWKRGRTVYREMKRLGANEDAARRVAANARRWWCNSEKLLNTALPTSYYDRMGVPRLAV